MLTILWRKPDGSEQIFAAETLHRVQHPGQECVPAFGPFRAYGVTLGGIPADYMEFDIEGPFGAVFVMNQAGATVARYMASPGSRSSGDYGAVPRFFSAEAGSDPVDEVALA